MPSSRVLQVALSLNPGGTERLIVELAKRLHGQIPSMVCCLDAAGSWARELEDAGIEVVALKRIPGFHPSLARAIAELSRRHRATVIHAHHFSPMTYSVLSRLWRPSTRVIFTEHGRLSTAATTPKRRLAARLLGRLPERSFAVSRELREHLVAEGFPRSMGVIYNGIDIGPVPDLAARDRIRRQLQVEDKTFVIGTIARLDPIKDLGTLIAAAKMVAGSAPVKLVLIGDGPDRQRLARIVDETGKASMITFLGHRDDARDWLAGFDAYVNCSLSEGGSLTILEAMAAGLPVVATQVGGTPEVIDETCGRLVPVQDPDALAASLLEFVDNAALRHSLAAAGRQRVETRFTLDRMVAEYRGLYVELT